MGMIFPWEAPGGLQPTGPSGPHFCKLQPGWLVGLQSSVCGPLLPMKRGNRSPVSSVGMLSCL